MAKSGIRFVLNGVSYLLIVDYFSRFPEIIKMKTTTSASIIEALKTIFSRHGIPESLISDNGPQYASQEFTNIARSYNFCHVMSSPHFPQSNGQAERTVRTIKKLLKESDDPHMALLTDLSDNSLSLVWTLTSRAADGETSMRKPSPHKGAVVSSVALLQGIQAAKQKVQVQAKAGL